MTVPDIFRQHLPFNTKSTISGWIAFNAPCCQHRGHSADKKKRAGVKFELDGIQYNCFNCGYTTGWQPGRSISYKLRTLMEWMGADQQTINQMIFEALKTESANYKAASSEFIPKYDPKPLPEGSKPLSEWIEQNETDPCFLNALVYISERGFDPLDSRFLWSPDPSIKQRVILPLTYNDVNVGFTARKVGKGEPKYLSDRPQNFVFNTDAILNNQRYLFVVEGPFDALAVNGVAVTGSTINDQQAYVINSLADEIIVIPDQDKNGLHLADRAIELGWSVAFPNWDDDVKDPAEAVARYSKLYVVADCIATAVGSPAAYSLYRSKLQQKINNITQQTALKLPTDIKTLLTTKIRQQT